MSTEIKLTSLRYSIFVSNEKRKEHELKMVFRVSLIPPETSL